MQNISVRVHPSKSMSGKAKDTVAAFLHQHLDQYGDDEVDIRKAIAYAMQEHPSPGGFVLTCVEGTDEKIIGAVVVNRTGMEGYIPDNILVYIAMDANYRGRGIGRALMEKALETADGDVALHVEADNPAKFLYEKLGFENKYLEMRYKKPAV